MIPFQCRLTLCIHFCLICFCLFPALCILWLFSVCSVVALLWKLMSKDQSLPSRAILFFVTVHIYHSSFYAFQQIINDVTVTMTTVLITLLVETPRSSGRSSIILIKKKKINIVFKLFFQVQRPRIFYSILYSLPFCLFFLSCLFFSLFLHLSEVMLGCGLGVSP